MRDIANECRQASCVMQENGTFQTGQSILMEAADEIERLQKKIDGLKQIVDAVETFKSPLANTSEQK